MCPQLSIADEYRLDRNDERSIRSSPLVGRLIHVLGGAKVRSSIPIRCLVGDTCREVHHADAT